METKYADKLSEVLNIGDEFTTDEGETMKVVDIVDGEVVAEPVNF